MTSSVKIITVAFIYCAVFVTVIEGPPPKKTSNPSANPPAEQGAYNAQKLDMTQAILDAINDMGCHAEKCTWCGNMKGIAERLQAQINEIGCYILSVDNQTGKRNYKKEQAKSICEKGKAKLEELFESAKEKDDKKKAIEVGGAIILELKSELLRSKTEQTVGKDVVNSAAYQKVHKRQTYYLNILTLLVAYLENNVSTKVSLLKTPGMLKKVSNSVYNFVFKTSIDHSLQCTIKQAEELTKQEKGTQQHLYTMLTGMTKQMKEDGFQVNSRIHAWRQSVSAASDAVREESPSRGRSSVCKSLNSTVNGGSPAASQRSDSPANTLRNQSPAYSPANSARSQSPAIESRSGSPANSARSQSPAIESRSDSPANSVVVGSLDDDTFQFHDEDFDLDLELCYDLDVAGHFIFD
ncbi:hypothetical protein Ddc_12941 [Ditylenchus destructor]|nr:hypothetical protein Ddc_12941 [Ditylenchus destructor]